MWPAGAGPPGGPATWTLPGKPPTVGKSQMQSCLLIMDQWRGDITVECMESVFAGRP